MLQESDAEPLGYEPRALALAYRSGDTIVYISPFRDILGGVLGRSPAVIGSRLRSTQRYKAWQKRQFEAGTSYRPLFPWEDRMLEEPDIAGAVRKAVKKREGVYTLVDAYPRQAVTDLTIKGHVLSAKVKSKSRPGGDVPTYYNVNVTSPYLADNGEMQLISVSCSCADRVIGAEKRSSRAAMRCMHAAAMNHAFASWFYFPGGDRPARMKGRKAGNEVFLPFSFTANYVPAPGGGFMPVNKHLAALEYDALAAYYLNAGEEDDHFGIDLRLYQLPEIYGPALTEAIRQGHIRREVVGQRPERSGRPRSELEAEEHVFLQMARELRRYGYHPEGRCLELGNRVANRYEKDDSAVNIVAGGEGPMFMAVRRATRRLIRPAEVYRGPDSPVMMLGADMILYDDRSMQDTWARVELPTAMRLPETGKQHIPISVPPALKAKWRKAVAEGSARGSATANLKYARLYY